MTTDTDRTDSDPFDTYFRLAVAPDLDAYFAQFAEDAVVEDEGHEHHGIEEIRAWRTSVPAVRYDILDTAPENETTTVRAAVSGDFPGSPVTLGFRFGLDPDGRISLLTIRA